MWVEKDPEKKNTYWPSEAMKERAWASDEAIYAEAAADPVAFWTARADELHWFKRWESAYEYAPHAYKWFVGGKTNLSYNSLDRHIEAGRGDHVAVIWEPEPVDEEAVKLTYKELHERVSRFANVLRGLGVEKGDRVGIYLPMIPEAVVAMQACARIGAPHSVVFSAFSPDSLRDRLVDAGAKVLITADGYYRRGKQIDLKKNADLGVTGSPVEKVVVVQRLDGSAPMEAGRDAWYHELMADASPDCPAEPMDAEDLAFLLYTSGTTGKPKGIMHTTGGYAVQAHTTAKWNYDLHEGDIFWCTADVGWITGHTYINYGPLLNGVTTLVYEGSPDAPDNGRFWAIIEKHKVTQLYTAPTAIRMFVKWGDEWPAKYDLSSLRLLGTVGEPINVDAWNWYFEVIGGGRCPVIDTWWQTETGANMVNSLPGIGPFVPTIAGRPFPGILGDILDSTGQPLGPGEGGYLAIFNPFPPALTRGIYGDPERFKAQYYAEYGPERYFTSDGARKDAAGNIRITGRVDDVMNVAGHRLATAEVESALAQNEKVSEVAVVSRPHDVKGEVPIAFVLLRGGIETSDDIRKELMATVNQVIGPTGRPDEIIFVPDVPKTRSGKIMRRVLKALVRNEPVGDLTTLQNPESVDKLKELVGHSA
ncbi:MAG: acetate--CoA ligase [Candidatus Bipolaricaulota bacterium]|nr:MAG: acetate--CoA ligase [Candidatus Bipolaricaulota bacterium]